MVRGLQEEEEELEAAPEDKGEEEEAGGALGGAQARTHAPAPSCQAQAPVKDRV